MDIQTLEILQILNQEMNNAPDWKGAMDILLSSLRGEFIYDNVAVYLLDAQQQGLEVAYARASGRGKSAEADAAWGEVIANEVSGKVVLVDDLAENYLDNMSSVASKMALAME